MLVPVLRDLCDGIPNCVVDGDTHGSGFESTQQLDLPFAATGGFDAIVIVVVVLIAVVGIGFTIYRWKRISDKGYNPLTVEWQLQDAAMDHLRPEHDADAPVRPDQRSASERLAGIDALLAAGTISPAERDSARARIIAEL